jgi:hypothetical protein
MCDEKHRMNGEKTTKIYWNTINIPVEAIELSAAEKNYNKCREFNWSVAEYIKFLMHRYLSNIPGVTFNSYFIHGGIESK